MTGTERHIWRSLKRHVKENHTLRIKLVDQDSLDLQMECVFCGLPLMAGSPGIVNHIGQQLLDAGVKVVRPSTQPYVKLQ